MTTSRKTSVSLVAFAGLLVAGACFGAAPGEELQIGLIGLDTSHVVAFTKALNDPSHPAHIAGGRVVAAYKGGSMDIPSSRDRIEEYTKELQEKYGVKLVDSIEALCREVDAVMLESVDGRPHLEQARPVIAAGKPLYIDKPMAASLRDGLEIFRLAKAAKVPVFSASSLRFGKSTIAVRNGAIGKVLSAETFCPVHLEPHHPELFWYGIHGVESLFTVMGAGCEFVKRGLTADGRVEVTGTWKGGRTGIFRQAPDNKSYGGTAKGEKGEWAVGAYDGYEPLVGEIIKFFQTGVSPVPERETVEILAFMEASALSQERGGQAVSLSEVLDKLEK